MTNDERRLTDDGREESGRWSLVIGHWSLVVRRWMRNRWASASLALALAGGLGLLLLVRGAPLQPHPLLRFDALSAFFVLLTLGVALLRSLHYPAPGRLPPAEFLVLVALLLAYGLTHTLAIALCYLLVALLGVRYEASALQQTPQQRPQRQVCAVPALAVTLLKSPGQQMLALLAAACLVIGYTSLALAGAWYYDQRTAGLALGSLAFWFTLLAAAIPLWPGDQRLPQNGRQWTVDGGQSITNQSSSSVFRLPSSVFRLPSSVFRLPSSAFVWLYPLVRLYSLGPWNSGWSLATLLLGAALALWCALRALATASPGRPWLTQHSYTALALAGFGLASGAGLAAGCFALLVVLLLRAGEPRGQETGDRRQETGDRRQETGDRRQETEAEVEDRRLKIADSNTSILDPRPSTLMVTPSPLHPFTPSPTLVAWALSPALPLGAPFVAIWMLVGAASAAGVTTLALAGWAVGLLLALVAVLPGKREPITGWQAGVSLLLGAGAPAVVLLLIQPVIEQLQGGLTPFGDLNLWPWVGLALVDAGRRQVAVLPSLLIAGLMLVLGAFVYLVGRLVGSDQPAVVSGQQAAGGPPESADDTTGAASDLPTADWRRPTEPTWPENSKPGQPDEPR